jgi:hypothetical protein
LIANITHKNERKIVHPYISFSVSVFSRRLAEVEQEMKQTLSLAGCFRPNSRIQ